LPATWQLGDWATGRNLAPGVPPPAKGHSAASVFGVSGVGLWARGGVGGVMGEGHSHSLKPPKAVLFGRLPAASAPALGPSPTSLADERREQRSAESPQAACEP